MDSTLHVPQSLYTELVIYEQELLNTQRLKKNLSSKFVRRKDSMLLRSREGKELIQSELQIRQPPIRSRSLERRLSLGRSFLVAPLLLNSALTQTFKDSGGSRTK